MLQLPTIIQPLKPSFGRKLRTNHWSTDGLVGYWPFTKAANLVDFSFNRNHGEMSGGSWIGKGFNFPGAGEITISPIPVLNYTAKTVIVIYTSDSIDANNQVYSSGYWEDFYGDLFMSASSDRMRIYVKNTAGTLVTGYIPSGLTIPEIHVAYTWNGAIVEYYANGVYVTGNSLTGTLSAVSNINISYFSARQWDGTVYNLKIFNRALSASEIAELYDNPDIPLEPEKFYFPVSAALALLDINVSDTITVTEIVEHKLTSLNLAVTDTISFAETIINKLLLLYKSVIDTITVTDTQIVTKRTYKLEGVTKDNDGSILANCECFLCKDNGDDIISFIAHDQSDGSGNYSFTAIIDHDANYFVIAWKNDSPHIFDITDHVLEPVVE